MIQDMKAILERFDEFLLQRKLMFETTVVGGAALVMMGVVNRATKDVDCLTPVIPLQITNAIKEFAKNEKLEEDWFNSGPASLAKDLPAGWQGRRVPLFRGKALVLITLGRLDLLRAKIFALLDRQQDLNDCLAMKPRPDELRTCYPWLRERDLNEMWPEHVRTTLLMLGKRLGYDLHL